ncbi:hypothetical protein [Noviherbaspirillum aerium]|uniref:hypothetical protein n=1 Tax=Noviherbaspirillum aerium TaxID=2588497 RepID=UPI00124D1F59|nr:hypothetical protein [Noviherbaspirillum aerium]
MTESTTITYPLQEKGDRVPTLFRATVYSTVARLDDHSPNETMAYIDALDRDDAARRMKQMLAALWHVPAESVEIHNLRGESELRLNSTHRDGADLRLFEIGWGSEKGPLYPRADELPYLLVRPETMKRLMAAWTMHPRKRMAQPCRDLTA